MKTFLVPLSPEEEADCLNRLKNGEREAKEELILHNMRLVAHVAKKYVNAEEDAEDLFTNISDLDYKKVDSFFVSYAEEGGKADEIAVIAVKNTADTEEAKKSLEAHKESRRKLLDQYEPEEVSRIKDGVIFTSGQYAVFIVSENSDAVRKAFEEAIK